MWNFQQLPGPRGKLNAFQRLMYHWSELYPYNATHTFKIAGSVRTDALRQAICDTYLLNRVGMVRLVGKRGSYHHETDDAPELTILPGGASPEEQLDQHLTAELNRPFPRPDGRPFRFSVIDVGSAAHYIILTYDHWVADSIATRFILRHVLGRYLEIEDAENQRPLLLHPGTFRDVLRGRLSVMRAAKVALHLLAQWWASRNVAQVPYVCSAEMSVQHEVHQTAPGTVCRLVQFARAQDATVHDVIQAALSRAMFQALPRRATAENRELAIGSIVDTRADSQEDLSESLGVFLAYYLVRCTPGKNSNLAALTRQIAETTGPIKSECQYLDSLVHMKLANVAWPWLSGRVRAHIMRKMMPITAGISNVRLHDSWINRYRDGRILDYSRGAPTGPLLPLVLTPTTLSGQMNVGVTYRAMGFSRAKIDAVMSALLEQIEHPDGGLREWHIHRDICATPELNATAF